MEQIYQQYMYSYPHKTSYYPIERARIFDQLSVLSGDCTLYLHIPFCQAKCGYCNLFSIVADKQLMESYIEAVEKQCRQLSQIIHRDKIRFSGLVLGGGTPSILTIEQLKRLLSAVGDSFSLSLQNLRKDIEVAPNQADDRMIAFLKEAGFHRVSMGVQSFVAEELLAIGRIHTPQVCSQALTAIREAGFACVNSDLIYGLPNQTKESFAYSIDTMLAHNPDELFLYPFYVKPYTPLWGKFQPDQVKMKSFYDQALEKLCSAGYFQVSMRRFVRTKPEQWEKSCGFDQGLALGCGGRSYLGNLHICEPYQVKPADCKALLHRFCEKTDFLSGLSGYILSEEERKRRYLIKNLLHTGGILEIDYQQQFQSNIEEDFILLQELIKKGLVQKQPSQLGLHRYYLTQEGMARSDQIGPKFISQEVLEAGRNYYK